MPKGFEEGDFREELLKQSTITIIFPINSNEKEIINIRERELCYSGEEIVLMLKVCLNITPEVASYLNKYTFSSFDFARCCVVDVVEVEFESSERIFPNGQSKVILLLHPFYDVSKKKVTQVLHNEQENSLLYTFKLEMRNNFPLHFHLSIII